MAVEALWIPFSYFSYNLEVGVKGGGGVVWFGYSFGGLMYGFSRLFLGRVLSLGFVRGIFDGSSLKAGGPERLVGPEGFVE